MWALKTLAYFGLFWAGCVAALFNPVWGVLNYIIVYQLDPTDRWWGTPISDLGVRFSLFAALSILMGMLLARLKLPKIDPAFSWWEAGLIALFLVGLLNVLIGVGFGLTAQAEFDKFWKVLFFTFILGRVTATRSNLHMVLWVVVVGSLFLGYDAYTAPESSFVLGRLESIGGPDFSTTSGAAAHLGAMLPLIGAMFLIARDWKWKLLALLSGAFTANAIIMCRTRSAFVGLLAGTLAAVLMAPRARRFRIHALIVAGACMTFAITDEHFWDRMGTLADQQSLDTDLAAVSRREIWQAAVEIFEDHPLGIGVGNFVKVIGDYDPRHYKRSTHNTLVVCFIELGLQGGIIFLLLVAGSLRYVYLSYSRAHASNAPLETQLLAYGFLISLVTYLVTSLGTQRFYCESFWWVLAFPLCLHRVVAREASLAVEYIEEPEPAEEADLPVTGWELQHGLA